MVSPLLGVNTWVWTSPLTDEVLPGLLRRIAGLGFDAVELPLENPGDLDHEATAAVLAETGLTPYVVGAMAPGRDLVAASPDTVAGTQGYLRACVDLAEAVGATGVCGPFYASTGRAWRLDAEERETAYKEWREHLAPVAEYAGERGVRLGIEPLNRYETSLINTVDQALTALGSLLGPVGLALDTYHLNIEERSNADAVRHAGGAPCAPPGLRQRPRCARRRPDRLAGAGRGTGGGRLRRPAQHRELHPGQRRDRGGRLHLAPARGLP
jgi:D-psicose/D-tagatose/L-ribulose 3-epimerase